MKTYIIAIAAARAGLMPGVMAATPGRSPDPQVPPQWP
jgi:hypothetical protein